MIVDWGLGLCYGYRIFVFVMVEEIEVGFLGRITLWLFGFFLVSPILSRPLPPKK
jgi:hypothetical protein